MKKVDLAKKIMIPSGRNKKVNQSSTELKIDMINLINISTKKEKIKFPG